MPLLYAPLCMFETSQPVQGYQCRSGYGIYTSMTFTTVLEADIFSDRDIYHHYLLLQNFSMMIGDDWWYYLYLYMPHRLISMSYDMPSKLRTSNSVCLSCIKLLTVYFDFRDNSLQVQTCSTSIGPCPTYGFFYNWTSRRVSTVNIIFLF